MPGPQPWGPTMHAVSCKQPNTDQSIKKQAGTQTQRTKDSDALGTKPVICHGASKTALRGGFLDLQQEGGSSKACV